MYERRHRGLPREAGAAPSPTSAGPSTSSDSASSGTGTTTADQTVSDSPPVTPAARETTLPIPHDSAAEQAQRERGGGDVPTPPGADHDQADRAERDAGDLGGGRPLAQHPGRDHDREDDLRLEHQRGQAGRHAGGHRHVEEAELAQRHEHARPPPAPATARRAGGTSSTAGKHHDREPDRGEQQRRHALHAPVDDHEVEAPDRGDQGGEERVAAVHALQRPGRRP